MGVNACVCIYRDVCIYVYVYTLVLWIVQWVSGRFFLPLGRCSVFLWDRRENCHLLFLHDPCRENLPLFGVCPLVITICLCLIAASLGSCFMPRCAVCVGSPCRASLRCAHKCVCWLIPAICLLVFSAIYFSFSFFAPLFPASSYIWLLHPPRQPRMFPLCTPLQNRVLVASTSGPFCDWTISCEQSQCLAHSTCTLNANYDNDSNKSTSGLWCTWETVCTGKPEHPLRGHLRFS